MPLRRAGTCLSVVAPLLWSPMAGADELAERGKELSKQHCARCHVVSDDNRFSGISSTPSFKIIVQALEDWRDRFETFHARLPHPSVIRVEGVQLADSGPPTTVQVELSVEDIEAFVAYAETFSDK